MYQTHHRRRKVKILGGQGLEYGGGGGKGGGEFPSKRMTSY